MNSLLDLAILGTGTAGTEPSIHEIFDTLNNYLQNITLFMEKFLTEISLLELSSAELFFV